MVKLLPFLSLSLAFSASDPVDLLIEGLKKEANYKIVGEVSEIINFPPRLPAKQTRRDLAAPPLIAPELIKKNFQINISQSKVATRKTWKISFVPFNRNAASFNFWLDQEWGMRLAYQEINWQGKITAQARFNVIIEGLEAREIPRSFNELTKKSKLVEKINEKIGNLYLPDGFEIVGLRKRIISSKDSLEIRSSNGLSTLIVVISPAFIKKGPNIAIKQLNNAWVWAIANLPNGELEKIVQSFDQKLDMKKIIEENF